MNPALIVALLDTFTRLGMKVLEKRSEKPIEEWTDADALKWIREYKEGIKPTDEILGLTDEPEPTDDS